MLISANKHRIEYNYTSDLYMLIIYLSSQTLRSTQLNSTHTFTYTGWLNSSTTFSITDVYDFYLHQYTLKTHSVSEITLISSTPPNL